MGDESREKQQRRGTPKPPPVGKQQRAWPLPRRWLDRVTALIAPLAIGLGVGHSHSHSHSLARLKRAPPAGPLGPEGVPVPNEVGCTKDRDLRITDDILEIFATIGLKEPAPIPLMLVEHQVAQKLHACTWVNPKTNRNDRAHDLVDLQILEPEETIDYAELREIGTRLFAARPKGSTSFRPSRRRLRGPTT